MTSIRFDQSCNLIGQSEARSCRNALCCRSVAVLLPSWALPNFQNETKQKTSFFRTTHLFYQIIQPENIHSLHNENSMKLKPAKFLTKTCLQNLITLHVVNIMF